MASKVYKIGKLKHFTELSDLQWLDKLQCNATFIIFSLPPSPMTLNMKKIGTYSRFLIQLSPNFSFS